MPLGFPSIYQTKSIALNVGSTIVNARVVVDTDALSDEADFSWYLTADGGTTWEEVTLNDLHTFTTTGDDLRLQILGNPGATITIRQADGEDLPIRVIYNE